MEIQDNVSKAKDITKCLWFPQKCTESDIQKMLIAMAKWKDEQFAQEKQQLIDKAMKVICNGCAQKVECEFNNWKTCSTKDELIKSIEE